MSARRRRSRRGMRGQTLISMMIGLVISLLTIGAMLAIYRIVIDVSGSAASDAQRDGQVASAILAAQIELQQAGFGIEAARPVADGPELPVPADIVSIQQGGADGAVWAEAVWRYKQALQDSDTRCAGLRIEVQATGAAAMYSLHHPGTCTDASAEHGAAWQRQVLAAYDKPWVSRLGAVDGPSAGGFRLSDPRFEYASGETCTLPYAQQRVDPSAARSTADRLRLVAGGQELFSVCLSNVETRSYAAVAGENASSQGGSP